MSYLKKMPGTLAREGDREVYRETESINIDYESWGAMNTNDDALLPFLQHVAPADIRVFLSVLRRINRTTGYAIQADYITIAADLNITKSVAFRALQRLAKPILDQHGDALVPQLISKLLIDSGPNSGLQVILVNPNIAMAGRHKTARYLWALAGRQAAERETEKAVARVEARIADGYEPMDAADCETQECYEESIELLSRIDSRKRDEGRRRKAA